MGTWARHAVARGGKRLPLHADHQFRDLPATSLYLRPLTSDLCLPAIAAAARELVVKRDLWLKPEGASPADIIDGAIIERVLALNLERSR